MVMGRKAGEAQGGLWVETSRLPKTPGHPFYDKLNEVLAKHKFDAYVEERCAKFYAEVMGRPSMAPGMYFRMLLLGYFEGIDSERGIAWRCGDSLTVRGFIGVTLEEGTPEHSTVSRTRRLIDVETHREIFGWALEALAKEGLVNGKTIGVDATTLEANAALKSIVRRDTGDRYDEFLTGLAKASGIETPTREDLAKLDRKRKNKASNEDWKHPHDPDARITKMKDGRTHLAHKAEHAIDMDTGAVLGLTLQGADQGDTTTIVETVAETADRLEALWKAAEVAPGLSENALTEVVADKGYHSNEIVTGLTYMGARTYVSEPDRGRRKWVGKEKEKAAVYANRKRVRGVRGKRLMRRRGELIERSFAHCYETGGMRRVHLRHRENILKRLLIHVAGFNLGLVMRKVFGLGTPRGLQGGRAALLNAGRAFMAAFKAHWEANGRIFLDLLGFRVPALAA